VLLFSIFIMGGGVSRPSISPKPTSSTESKDCESARLPDDDSCNVSNSPQNITHDISFGVKDDMTGENNLSCEDKDSPEMEMQHEEEALALVAAMERHIHRYDNFGINEDDEYYGEEDIDEHNDPDDEDDVPENDSNASENRENWNMLTNSLDMDGEDLLFNMLYFSSGDDIHSGGQMINNALSETVALHSENNTPYKLRPVAENDLKGIESEELSVEKLVKLKEESGGDSMSVQCCCCMEDLEIGEKIVKLPECNHSFHAECLFKWFRMQNWCPICRTPLCKSLASEDSTNTPKRVDPFIASPSDSPLAKR
jgi:hypothetical protein